MRYDITLKNYRCFPMDEPARFAISTGGATAFVGPNNAGKSAPLRFFYEFRDLFSMIAISAGQLAGAMARQPQGVGSLRDVRDPAEVFHNRNTEGLTFELDLSGIPEADLSPLVADRLCIRVDRSNVAWTAELSVGGAVVTMPEGASDFAGTVLRVNTTPLADLGPLMAACRNLASSVYLGSARSAVNVAGGRYFDMSVGTEFVTAWREFKSGNNKANNEAALKARDDIARILSSPSLN